MGMSSARGTLLSLVHCLIAITGNSQCTVHTRLAARTATAADDGR